jgi:serine/threonine protein kinase
MPPEIKNQVGYNYHADFYTLGAFLCEMITGLPPYYDNRALEFPEKTSFEAI